MNVVSICRSRSGLAWASCSCRKWAGSILLGAVIASNSWGCGRYPEDHAVAASTWRARWSPGRRTPPWWTPLSQSSLCVVIYELSAAPQRTNFPRLGGAPRTVQSTGGGETEPRTDTLDLAEYAFRTRRMTRTPRCVTSVRADPQMSYIPL